jgi:hypothetical protein
MSDVSNAFKQISDFLDRIFYLIFTFLDALFCPVGSKTQSQPSRFDEMSIN